MLLMLPLTRLVDRTIVVVVVVVALLLQNGISSSPLRFLAILPEKKNTQNKTHFVCCLRLKNPQTATKK